MEALELASTIRHDGHGGVADDLETAEAARRWRADIDEELRSELITLRRAIRALFARAVRPGPPSPADARRLMPVDEALSVVNNAAALDPVAPQLSWSDKPLASLRSVREDARARLLAGYARSAIEFLAGPDRDKLTACTAPRCVRYFVKTHGRQEFCKTSCANRARAARFYDRRRADNGG
ncbi:CGNR zinc finger domain-containing protein [Kutzneria sp. CA-103260]|uniref:CGNR zinc finger domain-containing protein n=1 Tax=Kutzneria sp. CA-103260 TaxID=2802641 RepID=UPI001BAC5C2A|nr:ABATE domain-containing protein [Kutzneria sp. CA-103260]QUQ62853.1 Putative stress-induced transcription regulator [Kutzneria sp. CA-103260]